MHALIAQIARRLSLRQPANARRSGVARHLMESAEARAGSDPHCAQELRNAAYAYLRVVR
jgi:hypothetical protein